ncbi:MAG: NUDIX hydrolase [Pseudoalteromonas distincta]
MTFDFTFSEILILDQIHPRKHYSGREIVIQKPSTGSNEGQWIALEGTVTVVPDGPLPSNIHGIPVIPWLSAPSSDDGWNSYAASQDDFSEPPMVVQENKRSAAGAIIIEVNGWVWLAHPTNQFAGYEATFPKGTVDQEYSLRATAIKECYEETGLQIRLFAWLGDFHRSASFTRMYLAERIGGHPADMGWETQAVSLVPPGHLLTVANSRWDQPVINAILNFLSKRGAT